MKHANACIRKEKFEWSRPENLLGIVCDKTDTYLMPTNTRNREREKYNEFEHESPLLFLISFLPPGLRVKNLFFQIEFKFLYLKTKT